MYQFYLENTSLQSYSSRLGMNGKANLKVRTIQYNLDIEDLNPKNVSVLAPSDDDIVD
jgi:hypothetical protein